MSMATIFPVVSEGTAGGNTFISLDRSHNDANDLDTSNVGHSY